MAAAATAANTGAAAAEAEEADPDPDELPPTQLLTPPPPGVHPVQLSCARAVGDFRSRLLQFTQLGVPRQGWEVVDASLARTPSQRCASANLEPASNSSVQ